MFNAAEQIEEIKPLEYDFTAFGGKASKIPEPSTDQIVKFWADYAEWLQRTSNEKVDDVVDGKRVDNHERSMKNRMDMLALISELCSGVPTVDEINALPGRLVSRFVNYITGAVSPEA